MKQEAAVDPISDLLGVYSHTAGGEPTYRVTKKGDDYFWEYRDDGVWGPPAKALVITDAERSEAAAKGLTFTAGLHVNRDRSADQQFDILRVEQPATTAGGRAVVGYVMFSWFGPNVLHKLTGAAP
jgi:hypothetical protein